METAVDLILLFWANYNQKQNQICSKEVQSQDLSQKTNVELRLNSNSRNGGRGEAFFWMGTEKKTLKKLKLDWTCVVPCSAS